MLTLAQNGYTRTEVVAALTAASRSWAFRYELLGLDNELLGELGHVASASVEYNALAQVNGTGRFVIEETDEVDYLRDRIRPWARLTMPANDRGDPRWAEWPVGVYLLSTPTRQTTRSGRVIRDLEGMDQGLVLEDDKVADRYHVEAGTSYTDAVVALVGDLVPSLMVVPTSLVLPADKEWKPGTSRAAIAGELLTAANYSSLYFDGFGVGQVRPYTSPQDRAASWDYANGPSSVILPEVAQERDLYGIANRWVLYASEPDSPPLVSERTNDSPASPTSTVNRGRTITDFREVEGDAPDQATLDARVERLAFEASQVYEAVEFTTGLMPFHEHGEVYTVGVGPLGLAAKFSEHTWGMELRAGATMKHRARRVVTV